MKTRLCVVAVVALAVWCMKRHYADSRPDDLWWILSPTARLVGGATGATFTMAPGEGYVSRERLFLIEKSCAGINFMIAAFGMLVLALCHRCGDAVSALRILGDRPRNCGEIGPGASLEVEGEFGIRQQIRVPGPAARRAAQERPPVVAVHPDLDPPRLAAATTCRGDVDRTVGFQRPSSLLIHRTETTPRAVAVRTGRVSLYAASE